MDIVPLLILLWIHFIGDFMLQSDRMAKNKSTSNQWLASHIGTYTLFLMLVAPFTSILYVLVNGLIHGMIDYVTSRKTSQLWKEKRTHDFFVVIGLDQVLHATTLILTYNYMIL